MKTDLPKSRKLLLQRVGMELGRELAAQTVFFHEAAARRIGLNATDTRCLDLIARSDQGSVTAGDLARATGLTTGAVTGILDRLEKAGMVERVRDAADRRKVTVRPLPEAMRGAILCYEKLGAAMAKLAASYSTRDLQIIEGFLEKNLAILKEQIGEVAQDL